MGILQKIATLGDAGKYDKCTCTKCGSNGRNSKNFKPVSDDPLGNAALSGIYYAATQNGKQVPLFKTLYTNTCSFDCKYCQNAVGCKKNPASYQPEELAKVFISLHNRGYVEGLFLSSAIPNDSNVTTEKMLETVKLIREKYNFQGYIHFKVLPGTNYELIKEASEYSNRLSINLEASSKIRLDELSSTKDYKNDILKRQAWIKRMRLSGGQTTQFVVGGSNETDFEIIRMMKWEYENMNMKRVYFSAFFPISGTPLENHPQVPLNREVRLYNTDWLLRIYNYKLDDIKEVLINDMLPREDPKVLIARNTFDKPIDINESSYDELIRIPGIGPKTAGRIARLKETQKKRFRKYEELQKTGVILKRAMPFIQIDGKTQKTLV